MENLYWRKANEKTNSMQRRILEELAVVFIDTNFPVFCVVQSSKISSLVPNIITYSFLIVLPHLRQGFASYLNPWCRLVFDSHCGRAYQSQFQGQCDQRVLGHIDEMPMLLLDTVTRCPCCSWTQWRDAHAVLGHNDEMHMLFLDTMTRCPCCSWTQ
jgi:hypothetical protein